MLLIHCIHFSSHSIIRFQLLNIMKLRFIWMICVNLTSVLPDNIGSTSVLLII